jgi:hypothetical protein
VPVLGVPDPPDEGAEDVLEDCEVLVVVRIDVEVIEVLLEVVVDVRAVVVLAEVVAGLPGTHWE